jgi:hypothetical protein
MSRDDYIEVSERLQTFYDKHPDGSLQTEYDITEVLGQTVLIVKAYAYRTPDDPRPGIGHAWELVPGRTPFTKGSELMVGETSAWGRALAALGIAVHRGIASAQEVRAAESRRTTRVKTTPDDDPFYAPETVQEAAPRPDGKTPYQHSVPHDESHPKFKPASDKQLGMIHAIVNKLDIQPAQRITILNELLIKNGMKTIETSTKELSSSEASYLIGRLQVKETEQAPP